MLFSVTLRLQVRKPEALEANAEDGRSLVRLVWLTVY